MNEQPVFPSASDLLFARLPEEDKKRLLAGHALRKHNPYAAAGLVTPEEFNAYQAPPLHFLVDGLLAAGHLAMLGGRPKSGKSWLVAQLAQALDLGLPFLGRPTRPARVLYLALEDKGARLSQRAQVLGWLSHRCAFKYDVAPFDGPDGRLGPGLEFIERHAFDFDAILIDTLLATLSGSISENDNTAMGAIVNELATIAHGANCAILLVHHVNKGFSEDVFNLLRGASALRGAYDVGMLMDRKPGEREAVLHVEARDFESLSLTIRQRDGGQGWDLVGAGQERERIRAAQKVLAGLKEFEEGATIEQLAELIGISKSAVYQQLKRAERDGQVVRTRSMLDSGGRPADTWRLVNSDAPAEAFLTQPPLPETA